MICCLIETYLGLSTSVVVKAEENDVQHFQKHITRMKVPNSISLFVLVQNFKDTEKIAWLTISRK